MVEKLFKLCALGLWTSLAWSLWLEQAFALVSLLLFFLLAIRTKHMKSNGFSEFLAGSPSPSDPVFTLGAWMLLVSLSWLSAYGKPFEPERCFGLWVMLAVLPVSLFALRPLLKRELAWMALAAVLALVGAYALVQYVTGIDLMRPGHPATYLSPVSSGSYAIIGTFDRHHTYATVTTLLLLMLGGRLLDPSSKGLRVLGVAALMLSGAAVLLCPSRAAWLGGLAGGTMLAASRLKKWKLLAILIPCIVLFLALFPPSRERLLQAANRFGLEDRHTIASVARARLADEPLGFGYGRFAWEAATDFEATRVSVKVRSGTHADLLSMLAGGGPLLFLAWLALGASLFVSLGRAMRHDTERRGYYAGLMAAFVCYHLCALFHNALQDGEIAYVFWTMVGLVLLPPRVESVNPT